MPGCCSKLTKFQKLLLVLVFRPERLQVALINFACDALGVANISGNSLTVKQIAERETNPDTPALFIVSAGYDPSKEL